MTNFVELCQRVRQECGVAGEGPTTTIGQIGVLKKIVDRTARAWVDIQTTRPYWNFLRRKLSFPLIVAQPTYVISAATPAGFGLTTMDKFDVEASFIYLTSTSDETQLEWIDFQQFRTKYRTLESGRPTRLYMGPLGIVGFNRSPDAAYTITLEYWKTPELLVNPTDIPALPAQYVDVIVWKSVMMFAGNEMAPDLYTYAKQQYDRQYLQLVLDQTDAPQRLNNYPLATGSARGFISPFNR
jgi:hypothetical protein